METGATAFPVSYHNASEQAGFYFPFDFRKAVPKQQLSVASDIVVCGNGDSLVGVNVKDEPGVTQRGVADRKLSLTRTRSEESSGKSDDLSLHNPDDRTARNSSSPNETQSSRDLPAATATTAAESEAEFSVYEPDKEFHVLPLPQPEELQVPKSEFSLEIDLEEGEIISPENSRGGTTAEDHASAKSSSKRRGTSDYSDANIKRSRPQAMSKSPSPKRKRRSCAGRTTYASDGRSSSERTWAKERSKSAKNRGCRTEAHYSARDRRRRPRSSSSDWDPHENPSGSRRGAERSNRNKRGVASKSNRRARNSILEAPKDDTSRRSRSDKRIEQQQNVRRSSRRSSRSVTKAAEEKSKEDFSRKRSSASTTSCTLSKALSASKACISVSCDYTSKESNVATVNHDVIMKPLRVEVESVDAAAATVMEEGVRTSADTSPAADAEVCAIESPFIPKTPTFNTPSDYSPLGTVCQLSRSSPGSDLGVPVTPRDDARTRSPTLLRAPSAISRALFAKVEVTVILLEEFECIRK
ncbi:hypothetical protein TELCIR_07579 [Teladorsagia circumcincta]|uniref:Uncharacterized protein n=1 Tax=Teladorsagia circumcincta TaxID=45464 RepID=A0A2G9UK93_TELCI|nr:hypothetical protein TELCIR_07579 [Teladorsagia circumcincta]